MTTDPKILRSKPDPYRGERGHDFWPLADELRAIPAMYGVDDTLLASERVVHLHYTFESWGEWWVTEFDPSNGRAYGFVRLYEQLCWGWMDLPDLASYRIEAERGFLGRTLRPTQLAKRDLSWSPRVAPEVGNHIAWADRTVRCHLVWK